MQRFQTQQKETPLVEQRDIPELADSVVVPHNKYPWLHL